MRRQSIHPITLFISLFFFYPTIIFGQGIYSEDSQILINSLNDIVRITDSGENLSTEARQQVMEITCETGRIIIEREMVTRQAGFIQAFSEKERENILKMLEDDELFEQFLVTETEILSNQGATEQSINLAMDLLNEARDKALENNDIYYLREYQITTITKITCANNPEPSNNKVLGAVKLIGGLTIVSGDATAWVASLGFGTPLVAASAALGGIIAGDGYEDLQE